MTKRLDAPSSMVRIRVYKRDRFRCTYCGVPGTDAELEVDHIVPVCEGGSHHLSNLTTACRRCNQKKGTKAAGTVTKTASPAFVSDGVVGLYLHTIKDGKIHWQGLVLSREGPLALVQLFSWIDGRSTQVMPMQVDDLLSDRCRLYSDKEAWVEAHLREMHREGHLHLGSVEQCLQWWREGVL